MPRIVECVERYVRSSPCLSVRECVSRGVAGADPGFFLGGGAPLRNDVTDW